MNQQERNEAKSVKKSESDVARVLVTAVRENYAYVHGFFLRETGDWAIAADLSQTVFEKLIASFAKRARSHKKLPRPAAINPYIGRTARNCLRDFRRPRSRRRALAAVCASTAGGSGVPESVSSELDPAKLAEDAEISTKLNAIFLALPAKCFECVCMRYQEGLSYKEIAKKLDISANSVGVYLKRAHDILRENSFVRSLLEED